MTWHGTPTHTHMRQPMSLLSINILHLAVSNIQRGQALTHHPPARPPPLGTMSENNVRTALKGYGVKSEHKRTEV